MHARDRVRRLRERVRITGSDTEPHATWVVDEEGVVPGPVAGKLLAEQMVTGTVPEVLAPFDPLR